MLLFVHPLVQMIAIVLVGYTFVLGLQRFRSKHLRQPVSFAWQRHVWLGSTALLTLTGGVAAGLLIVFLFWHRLLLTGLHGRSAIVLLPFLLFGLISGWRLHTVKRKRTVLPIIHGINNTVVLGLCLLQIASGIAVLRKFVL